MLGFTPTLGQSGVVTQMENKIEHNTPPMMMVTPKIRQVDMVNVM
jgi:hypothetical protein